MHRATVNRCMDRHVPTCTNVWQDSMPQPQRSWHATRWGRDGRPPGPDPTPRPLTHSGGAPRTRRRAPLAAPGAPSARPSCRHPQSEGAGANRNRRRY
eukprot:365077-Chlamydomonas_euryale.AAC.3